MGSEAGNQRLSAGDVGVNLGAFEATVTEEAGNILYVHTRLQEVRSHAVAQYMEAKAFALHAGIFAEAI